MNLSLYIAKRYIFSRKRHQVINIISGVAVAGVALATVAMVCTLSVFNGFQGVVAKQFTAMDPDVKVTVAQGKSFDKNSGAVAQVAALPSVSAVSFSVEDVAMVQYGGRQVMATIKGVDESFCRMSGIGDILYGNGELVLYDGINSYAIMGAELMQQLNCGVYFTTPLEVFAPNRKGKVNLTIPASNFKKAKLLSSGLVFMLNQPKYDAGYIITSDIFAREIFRRGGNEVTSMDIKVRDGEDIDEVKENVASILGEDFVVQDRYEQQRDIYKVMQVEKLISYIFLSFILLVACFNIIGSLSMLIIEKRDNMNTLRSLGADTSVISNIFVFEGCIISAAGAASGVILGLLFCLLQQQFGFISMGGGDDFVVSSYPVEVEFADVALVFVTVLAVGFMAVWLPVKALTKRFI